MERQIVAQPHPLGLRRAEAVGPLSAHPACLPSGGSFSLRPLQNRRVGDFPSIGEETVLGGNSLAPADPLYERF